MLALLTPDACKLRIECVKAFGENVITFLEVLVHVYIDIHTTKDVYLKGVNNMTLKIQLWLSW